MISEWVPDLVTYVRTAQRAADAARAVPGVVRLQPGVIGLLGSLLAEQWERATGEPVPDIAGVLVDRAGDLLDVEVRIVLHAEANAAVVGADVHRVVLAATSNAANGPPTRVRVLVVSVDLC